MANIELTKSQKERIKRLLFRNLQKARVMAAEVNRKEKKKRIRKISEKAKLFIEKIELNSHVLKLILSALYLGEGTKREGAVELGSSNPKIAKAFVCLLRGLYKLDESRFKNTIFGRYDQIPDKLEKYWSNLLKIPRSQFYRTCLDKRTKNSQSYKDYRGVCLIRYTDTALRREIILTGQFLLEKLIKIS